MFADGASLDGQYTVIGEVVSGMDVVDKLKKRGPDRPAARHRSRQDGEGAGRIRHQVSHGVNVAALSRKPMVWFAAALLLSLARRRGLVQSDAETQISTGIPEQAGPGRQPQGPVRTVAALLAAAAAIDGQSGQSPSS